MSGALQDLSEQSRRLVRQEVGLAVRETLDKAKQSLPAVGLLAASGVFGVLTIAASYRLSMRLLEKRLSPSGAALVAAAGYGGATACAALAGIRWLRETPLPAPSRTARDASAAVAGAAAGAKASGE